MKISLNNNINTYRPNSTGFSKQDTHTADSAKVSGNFDELTIYSNSRQIQEKTFSETLAKQISKEVRQSASPEKVRALQEQVESGSYKIDPYAIASKLMLNGEELKDD